MIQDSRTETLKSKILIITLFLTACISIVLFHSTTAYATSGGTIVGAIRWDGQIGDNAVGTLSGVGPEEERAMAPSQWHFRLPFYATEPTTNTDTMSDTTQAIMDQEIAYAKDAGINYWAFDWYGSETGMDKARNLYLSSTHKNDVNWSVILFTHPLSSSDLTWLVAQFQQPNFQKVAGGRPLVYAYNYSSLVDPAQIASLRSQTFAAMGVQPYIVALDYGSSAASSFAAQIGADAVSSYVTSGSNGQSYASLASSEAANWDVYKTTGYKVIPWVTQAWDPRPRIQLTSPTYQYASYSSNSYATPSTPIELAGQLQSAINWNANNASSADANTVLMYAWNEFSEGGYLCPTLIPGGGGINRDYLDAIKNVTSSTVGNGSGVSFITSQTLGSLRNNFTGKVGFRFTTPGSGMTVTALGRYHVNGNSGNHLISLYKDSDKSLVASCSVNASTGAIDSLGFQYCALTGALVLSPSTAYDLVSNETSGGDQWYDDDTSITIGIGTANQSAYLSGSTWGTHNSGAKSYGPVNAKYASTNLALSHTYSSSSNWDGSQTGDKAFDGNTSTNWQAGSGTTFNGQWLQVDFGTNVTFNQATMMEYVDNRTTGYRIEYWNGSSWQVAYTGTTIGTNKTVNFTAVTGSKARLYFTSGMYTPIIFEFQLFNQ
ncbi:hypothetical protein A8709_14240 [Paenibacillus pectinilyticus]|uniref:F5/8 type C domain-containing protein n=1 Tax=Paenibacillus pectinilyticus TaxID=512399 RepID=A0A1C1A3W8_9BACL|nr:discoidin domain-containing protein [Paenibacillus pectinilyticus]OCT15254.1 hypothetical protein A8709_14240 [Paenibacillus pectinilyticus]